jgi:hypothetical protein
MGLNENRKIQELKDKILPDRSKEIEEICGKAISYEVEWDTFDTFDALNFLDNISCHRLNMALRSICNDEMGKQAVRDGLKLIKLRNSKDNKVELSLSNGVLEMTNDYVQKSYSSDNAICAFLMEKL